MPIHITPEAEFLISGHGFQASSICASLAEDMPGALSVTVASPDRNNAEVILESRDSPQGDILYDLRVNFDFDGKSAQLKNFSIYKAAHKGLHIGTVAIRNLLNASQGKIKSKGPIDNISLTAELERGAWVWAKMGWLPTEASFRRFQKKVQPKLEALESVLPPAEKLDSQAYALFHTLLDSQISQNPRLIWPMTDSNLSYDLNTLKHLQTILQCPRDDERLDLLRDYVEQHHTSSPSIDRDSLQKIDKNLRFLRDVDLDGMARAGRVCTSLVLFSWERWEGALSFGDEGQMRRLESHLQKFEKQKALVPVLFKQSGITVQNIHRDSYHE